MKGDDMAPILATPSTAVGAPGPTGPSGPVAAPSHMAARVAVAIVSLVVLFGFALPRLADYGDARRALGGMSTGAIVALAMTGLWNLFTYWPVLMAAQPGLRLREAVVVNQASTAVANTMPGGGALALGVTYRMLRAWGFTTESIANLVVVTGVWNQLVKFAMPIVAIAVVSITGESDESFGEFAIWGSAGLLAILGAGFLVLRTEMWARAADTWLARAADGVGIGRESSGGSDSRRWFVDARTQLVRLLRRSGIRLTAATVVSHLSLYIVLMTALRGLGISSDAVSWSKGLVAFSLVRLLSAIPITPGGVGFVELGYVGLLATGGASGLESEIAAAVLIFRAITFVLPIALGAVAWIVFTMAASWRRPPDSRSAVPRAMTLEGRP